MSVKLHNYPMEMTINLDDFIKISPDGASLNLHSNGHDELILVNDCIIHLVYDENHRVIGKIYYKEAFKLAEPNNVNFKFHKLVELKYKEGEFKPYQEIKDGLIINNVYEDNKLLYATTSKGCTLRCFYLNNKIKSMLFEVLDKDCKYLEITFLTDDEGKAFEYRDNKGNYWHIDLGYPNPYYSVKEVRKLFNSEEI